jgi:hypothetical protein
MQFGFFGLQNPTAALKRQINIKHKNRIQLWKKKQNPQNAE